MAGLTNSSYLDDALEVRHCVRKHPSLGQLVLEVAKVHAGTRPNCLLYEACTGIYYSK